MGRDRPSAGGRSGSRDDRGRRAGGRGNRTSRGRGGGRGSRPGREDRRRSERTADQRVYDGPDVPESITGRELDRALRSQLSSLPDRLALRVARHLVAAQQLIESDPGAAYQHTLAARARAGRLAVVREAVGEAAYAAGEYSEALSELRAARRMNGVQDYVAIMADCERALGRPDRALEMMRDVDASGFAPALQAELTIVEAGARRDRGELDAALRTLERAPLQSKSREPWVARLRYAYADALAEAGRRSDALSWFHRAEAVDSHSVTDAVERAAEMERLIQPE